MISERLDSAAWRRAPRGCAWRSGSSCSRRCFEASSGRSRCRPGRGPTSPRTSPTSSGSRPTGEIPRSGSLTAGVLLRRHECLGARDRLPALSHAPAAEAPATRPARVSRRARRPVPEEPRRADHVEVPAGLLPASPPRRTCCRSCTPTPSGCTPCASVSAVLGAITVWLVLAAPARGRCRARDRLARHARPTPLLPMVSQASAICNPDVLLMAALAGLARSLLVLCRGWTRRSALVVALWALLATADEADRRACGGHGHRRRCWASAWGARTVRRRVAAVAAVAAALVVTYVVEAAAATWSPFGTTGPARRGSLRPLVPVAVLPAAALLHGHGARRLPLVPLAPVVESLGRDRHRLLRLADACRCRPGPTTSRSGRSWPRRPRGRGPASAGAVAASGRFRRCSPRRSATCCSCTSPRCCCCSRAALDLLLQGRYLIPIVPLFAAALYQPFSRVGRVGLLASRRAAAGRRRALGRGDERRAGVLWLRPRIPACGRSGARATSPSPCSSGSWSRWS